MTRYLKSTLGVLTLMLLQATACASFQYRYYGLAPASYEGWLLAREAKDDLPLKVCEPDDVVKGKCVVMLVDEFERMRAEREELIQRLKKCQ